MTGPLAFTLAAALSLAACHSEATRDKIEAIETDQQPATATARIAVAPAKPVSIAQASDLVEFSYSWPAEASAIPELDRRFRGDAAKQEAELADGAKEDKKARESMGGEFHQHSLSIAYQTMGQSPRLLSLDGTVESFTGGAHGMHGSRALLWDRVARREMKFADLFVAGTGPEQLRVPWCRALDAERATRRGAPVTGDDLFDVCPKFEEIGIVPVDKDGDGKFERLALSADPYVAGPYVEGEYVIELPVTIALIAAIKPDFQPSFAAL